MPPEVKKNRVVRVSETTWRAAQKVADQRGEVLSEIVRDALVGYVATADADVDLEPGWAPWPGFTEPHLVTMLRGEPGGVVWHHPRQAHYGHLGVPATNLVAEYDAAIAMAEQRGADKSPTRTRGAAVTDNLTREERVEMMTKNVEAVRKSTHPGIIAAGVTASLCSAIFDLADAFNNIADALRQSRSD